MDPKEIISDEESQALRETPLPGDPAGDVPAPEGSVKQIHPDHWDRILADRVPALESIAERMVSLLKTTGRRFFRRGVDVVSHPARVMRWGAYARNLPVPSSLNVFEIRPVKLRGVVSLNADFLYLLVDLFFGGDGHGKRADDMVEFSPMEQRLTAKFVEALATDMRDAWKPFIDLEFVLTQSETNPIFATVAAAADSISVWRFGFVIDDHEHQIEIVLPTKLVEPIRHLGDAGRVDNGQNSAQVWQMRLREDVKEARVSLRAVLQASSVNLRDIANARPGDVIATELPASVMLFAGDQALLEGTLGMFQGRNAVRVSKPVNRRMLGEKYGRYEDK